MPKQIKTKEIPKDVRRNRAFAVFAMLASFSLGALLLAIMSFLNKDKDPNAALGIGFFAAFAAFLVLTAMHLASGIIVYHKRENYSVLFSSIGSGISAFSALINTRFALALLCSSLGAEGTARKIVGGVSFATFMANQQTAWKLLLFSMVISMFVGFFASLRLILKK